MVTGRGQARVAQAGVGAGVRRTVCIYPSPRSHEGVATDRWVEIRTDASCPHPIQALPLIGVAANLVPRILEPRWGHGLFPKR